MRRPLAFCHRAVPSIAFAIAIASGCASSSESESDDKPTELIITAPERGTVLDDSTVTVRGKVVTGAAIESVTINGLDANIALDGSFSLAIDAPAGITMIDTVAQTDKGQTVRDRRAVLSGLLVPERTPIQDAVVGGIDPATVGVLGNIAGDFARSFDLTALAQTFNPVVDKGGSCLGVEVDVEDVAYEGLDIDLTLIEDGIDIEVTFTGLDVDMHASYKAACIGAGSGVDLTADSFVMRAQLELELQSDEIRVRLVDPVGYFTGFELDVGVIPSSVVSFFVDDIDQIVANLIVGPIINIVPEVVGDFMSEFNRVDFAVDILGEQLQVQMRPTEITLTEGGGTIAMESNAWIEEVSGGHYVASPNFRPEAAAMGGQGGLALAVADDVANQVLTQFWAAGVMEQSMVVGPGSTEAEALGGDIAELQFNLLLPPVVRADADTGRVQLLLGDLFIDLVDSSGVALARIVGTGTVDLTLELSSDGQLRLTTDVTDVFVAYLDRDDSAPLPPEGQLEAFAVFSINGITGRINQMLSGIPLPTFGAEIQSANLEALSGYLLLDGDLAAP